MRLPTRPQDEISRLGKEIYQRDIRRQVEADHHGEVVSIDVDTGAWAIAGDVLSSADRLRAQCPDAVNVWGERVGYRALASFGGRSLGVSQSPTPTAPTRPLEEVARLGDEIYERDIRAQVEAAHHGEYVAIDIDTGSWAIAGCERAAADRLRSQRPGVSDVWLLRVGYRAIATIR